MLNNSYALTYNAEALTLTRVNQDAYRSTYFGKLGTDRDVTLEVAHQFPLSRVKPGIESHMVKITLNWYSNVDGSLIRTDRTWTVIETRNGLQVNAASKSMYELLTELMTSGFQDQILNRES
jgi:hypothetical protein